MKLTRHGAFIGQDQVNRQHFKPWDYKTYDPRHDSKLLGLLFESLSAHLDGFIVGLPCRCCVGSAGFETVKRLTNSHTSWSNLLVNSNYPYFLEQVVPSIQESSRQVVLGVNKRSSLHLFAGNRPIHVPVPDNVFQDYESFFFSLDSALSCAEPDSIVLIGASTVAKIAIPKFYEIYPSMTFVDIGTTLNPLLGLDAGRDYLLSYWKGIPTEFGSRVCVW